MKNNKITFRNILINALQMSEYPPTDEEVSKKAMELASMLEYSENLADIINEVKVSINTKMGAGVSLTSKDSQHDPLWIDKRGIEWKYSDAYLAFLQKEGWPPLVVNALSNTTKKILAHLQDPQDKGSWSRRGLVIGNVQSGKTANYTGLIARAADAGYKIIIVIAGIHNNLRSQTQARIDESFIGRSSEPGSRSEKIGVALVGDYVHPLTVTNIYDDFNKNAVRTSSWELQDISQPIIFVIKKNVHTLKSLHEWLKEMNAKQKGVITDIPLLMIDDEADNASINTNKEENDPTKTNAGIRLILNLFSKSAYVGYTATPFANIFIDPSTSDGDLKDDLFPRDFMYCLDAPTNYFGANKIFGDDESSKVHIQIINDAEEYIPLSHKKDDEITDLPPSLYHALNSFIVVRAIRNIKGQENQHCSMMVNVSRFVDYQKQVENQLSFYADKIRSAVLSNSALPDRLALKNEYIYNLKTVFETEFLNEGFAWDEVKANLPGVFKNFKTFLINSESGDALDFSAYDKEGVGLTALAVGGLSLSRGLTIEGLTISYLYRNTQMYDTLMQMGRWFGYRPNYEKLCRIYLSNDSYNWYAHIAEASEELIQQVHEMSRQGKAPKDFGLVVKSHPDTLKITAPNKMLNAETVTVQQSYSGLLRETHKVSLDPRVNQRNFELIKEYWQEGFYTDPSNFSETGKGYAFRNVSLDVIGEFIEKFEVHPVYKETFSFVLEYLKAAREKEVISSLGDVLLISPRNGSGGDEPFILKNQERKIEKAEYEDKDFWSLSRSRVAGVGDEQFGLTEEEKEKARRYYLEDKENSDSRSLSDRHFRKARNRVLLMLHSLMPTIDGVPANLDEPVAALGVSFPPQKDDRDLVTVKVVANKVWLENEYNITSADELMGQQGDDE